MLVEEALFAWQDTEAVPTLAQAIAIASEPQIRGLPGPTERHAELENFRQTGAAWRPLVDWLDDLLEDMPIPDPRGVYVEALSAHLHDALGD